MKRLSHGTPDSQHTNTNKHVKDRFPTLTWWNPCHQKKNKTKLQSNEEFLKSWRQLKTLSSTGDHWDCNTIRSLAHGPKWITICFMQIEKGIVQNYREDCWICHWNSLGKKQFFLAIAETVLAGTRGVHWTPLMSILLGLGRSFSLIKPPVFQKVSGTKKNDLIWICGTSFMRNSPTREAEWMVRHLGGKFFQWEKQRSSAGGRRPPRRCLGATSWWKLFIKLYRLRGQFTPKIKSQSLSVLDPRWWEVRRSSGASQ